MRWTCRHAAGLLGKAIDEDNFALIELPAARLGRLSRFADDQHHADNVVGRQVDELGYFLRIESNHRIRVVPHALGGEHECLGRHATASHCFIAASLLVARTVKSLKGVDEKISCCRGSVSPVPLRVALRRFEVATKQQRQLRLLHMRLIPRRSTKLLFELGVANNHEPPVLNIEGGRCQQGEVEQAVDVGLRHDKRGVVLFNAAALLNGGEGIHVQRISRAGHFACFAMAQWVNRADEHNGGRLFRLLSGQSGELVDRFVQAIGLLVVVGLLEFSRLTMPTCRVM